MKSYISSGKKALAVLGLIILAYLLLDMNNRVETYLRLSAERDVIATQVAVLKTTEQALQTQISFANSDAAVEKWAREEAFMARPGDHPIIMIPDKNYTPQPTPQAIATKEVLQNWQVWAAVFFNQ